VDRPPVPVHLHRDGVDEEGHVVDHGLDDRVRRLPPVLLEARAVDVDVQLAGPMDARQPPVRERSPGEVNLAPLAQILGSDVRVVGADEPLDVVRLRGVNRVANARDDRLEEGVPSSRAGLVATRGSPLPE
jgi:hypothetical protein